jgi:hypothetical protein
MTQVQQRKKMGGAVKFSNILLNLSDMLFTLSETRITLPAVNNKYSE